MSNICQNILEMKTNINNADDAVSFLKLFVIKQYACVSTKYPEDDTLFVKMYNENINTPTPIYRAYWDSYDVGPYEWIEDVIEKHPNIDFKIIGVTRGPNIAYRFMDGEFVEFDANDDLSEFDLLESVYQFYSDETDELLGEHNLSDTELSKMGWDFTELTDDMDIVSSHSIIRHNYEIIKKHDDL